MLGRREAKGVVDRGCLGDRSDGGACQQHARQDSDAGDEGHGTSPQACEPAKGQLPSMARGPTPAPDHACIGDPSPRRGYALGFGMSVSPLPWRLVAWSSCRLAGFLRQSIDNLVKYFTSLGAEFPGRPITGSFMGHAFRPATAGTRAHESACWSIILRHTKQPM